MPAHLRPQTELAADVLLPGDPKRAMELAAALMEKPLMSNLSRGLWGYTGRTSEGAALTVQSTGIGGPSAAVVLAELGELGARRAIRIGTCVALDPGLEPGETILATGSVPGDGVTASLAPTKRPVLPDAALTERLRGAAPSARPALVATTDLYYDDRPERRRDWREHGAVAVELSAAALFAVARRAGIAAAAVLVVAESAAGDRLRNDELDAAALSLGELAGAALRDAAQASAEGASVP